MNGTGSSSYGRLLALLLAVVGSRRHDNLEAGDMSIHGFEHLRMLRTPLRSAAARHAIGPAGSWPARRTCSGTC